MNKTVDRSQKKFLIEECADMKNSVDIQRCVEKNPRSNPSVALSSGRKGGFPRFGKTEE